MSVTTSKRPLFGKVQDPTLNKNFDELTKTFVELYPGVWAREQSVDLATGDNTIVTGIPRAQGRIITFQSAAADLFDRGPDSSGAWVLNASVPCTVKIAFF